MTLLSAATLVALLRACSEAGKAAAGAAALAHSEASAAAETAEGQVEILKRLLVEGQPEACCGMLGRERLLLAAPLSLMAGWAAALFAANLGTFFVAALEAGGGEGVGQACARPAQTHLEPSSNPFAPSSKQVQPPAPRPHSLYPARAEYVS